MKIGDLVNFVSGFFEVQAEQYANPGVIIDDLGISVGTTHSFRVMWSDQKMTTEHGGYLEVINESR